MSLRTFLKNKSDTEMIQALHDYELFKKQGFIGDCVLRSIVEQYCTKIESQNITLWMNQVAFESYRRFALKYLEEAL